MKFNKISAMGIILFSLLLLTIAAESTHAALCAFRNPDRDVYDIFPDATGYRAITKKIDKDTRQSIEKFLCQQLDYDEAGEHTFYLILKDEEVIGVIHPHAERGKYGIVEMIWAFTLDGKIKDFTIQRSRERGTNQAKEDTFRKQFVGKTLRAAFTEKDSKKINAELFKIPKGAENVCSVVAYSARKNLYLYKHFFPKYNPKPDETSDGSNKKHSDQDNTRESKSS